MLVPTCSPAGCYCTNPDSCDVLQGFKKLLYCDDYKCLHNIPITAKKIIKHHKDDKPFEADAYRGVCGRPELGFRNRIVYSMHGKYTVTRCDYRSDKSLSDHMDFSKLLQPDGTPYGGNIPDAVDPGAAFHA